MRWQGKTEKTTKLKKAHYRKLSYSTVMHERSRCEYCDRFWQHEQKNIKNIIEKQSARKNNNNIKNYNRIRTYKQWQVNVVCFEYSWMCIGICKHSIFSYFVHVPRAYLTSHYDRTLELCILVVRLISQKAGRKKIESRALRIAEIECVCGTTGDVKINEAKVAISIVPTLSARHM